nr:hypothetical protein [Tanacetum cinerariifolium]
TMDITIDQQVALDEALIPHARRLRIGKINFRLRSDITSKESTLQLEFWATVTVHHHSIHFKMDNKKRIVNLEYFREMLHICPRLTSQTFDELPFEKEILAFLRFLRHSREIRKLTDEDFVYQVEHKDGKKSNEMYYPRFTKVIIHYFMTKDPSIPRRNKEYYAIASGAAPLKTKASVRKTMISSDTTITPPTAAGTRLSTSTKGKQHDKSSKAKGLIVLSEVAMTYAEHMKLAMKKSLQQTHISQASGSSADEGTGIIPGVLDVPTDEFDEEISWKSSDEDNDDDDDDERNTDNDGDDFVHPKVSIHKEEAKDEESFDPIVQTPENSNNASLGLNVGAEEGQDAEDDNEEFYRDVNIHLEGRDVQMTDVHTTQEFKDTHVTLTPVNPDGQQQSSSVSCQFVTNMLNPSPDACIDSFFETTPRVDVQASTTVAPLTLTAPTLPPPSIPTISQVPQAPTLPTTAPTIQIQSDRLRDEAQAKNEEFLNNLDENIQKIIKEQVKEHVKVQVSKILPKIKKTVNEQLEAEVLTRSSNSSKTSYACPLGFS